MDFSLPRLEVGGSLLRDLRPLLLLVELLEEGLVLREVIGEVLVEAVSEGVPEQLPPHQAAGDGVDKTVAVTVRMDGYEGRCMLIGCVQLLEDFREVASGAGTISSVAGRVKLVFLDRESSISQFRAVKSVSHPQLGQRLGSVCLAVSPVSRQQRREELALVVRDPPHPHQLRSFFLLHKRLPHLLNVQLNLVLLLLQFRLVLDVEHAVPLAAARALHAGLVGGEVQLHLALRVGADSAGVVELGAFVSSSLIPCAHVWRWRSPGGQLLLLLLLLLLKQVSEAGQEGCSL